MLGGVIIGLIEALGGQLIAARWTDVIIFSILVLVLVFRADRPARPRSRRANRRADDDRDPCARSAAGGAIGARLAPAAGGASARGRIADRRRHLPARSFRSIDRNDGDIDAAANARAFAALALGLNIVVGFAGLLDLGYAAFFAIGAYTYGILASWQVQPAWCGFWEPFAVARPGRSASTQAGGDVVHFTVSFWLMLPISAADRRRSSACCSARRPCGCTATTWPSSRWASARSCRSSRATRRSVTNGAHGPERRRAAAALRLQLRRRLRRPTTMSAWRWSPC